jgi:1-acyl-sn-glycerol-3-phosphate acyltransferase
MRLLYGFSWMFVRGIARSIFHLKIINEDNIPGKGGFIVACNHISLADPPLVGISIKRPVHFVAKKELFRNRLFGGLIRGLNAHPIRRNAIDRQALELTTRLLREGNGIIIFPEGSRSKSGQFRPAKPGIGMIARKLSAAVVPAYISGSNHLKNCFWGREKLVIIFGKPLDSGVVVNYDNSKEGYRKLADDIMARIKELKDELRKKSITETEQSNI